MRVSVCVLGRTGGFSGGTFVATFKAGNGLRGFPPEPQTLVWRRTAGVYSSSNQVQCTLEPGVQQEMMLLRSFFPNCASELQQSVVHYDFLPLLVFFLILSHLGCKSLVQLGKI